MMLIGNGRLITRDDAKYYDDGAVVIDGKLIKDVGTTSEMKAKYPEAEFIDAKRCVIMPGLINMHNHIYSAFARGLSIKGYAPKDFMDILDGQWWTIDRKLTHENNKLSAYAVFLDCIKNGVTTVFDHHASYFDIPGSLDDLAEAAVNLGVRSCLCYEVSDRDGEKKMMESVEENERFILRAQNDESDMLKGLMGLHASFTVSDRTIKLCDEHRHGAGYHVHCAEGPKDLQDSLDRYGKRIIERFYDCGVLGDHTLAVHCVHINKAEMELLRDTNSMVIHNPESNMGNAVGVAPVLKMFEKGILVGLGTDAYTHDMLESLKVELIIQRHNAHLPNVGWMESTGMLFRNNAKMVERYISRPIGVLKPGALADIAVFDYAPFTPFSDANIDGHMIFGFQGRMCTHTVINGKLLYKDRRLVACDEAAITERIHAAAVKLWGELNP